MVIKVLSPQLANQIAAGEVVERPSSVVKELLENSIDAGADNILIEIEQGGCKKIKITDNGSGIPKDELALALARHATSKISTIDDLDSIMSLGFRGEALASISSISRLTLTSKTKMQQEAWSVYVEGRDMAAKITPASHNDGTTIEILDIFYNTPARRRFLKSEKTEYMHIDETLRRIALACPHVSFVLKHNHKMVRQYLKSTTNSLDSKRLALICGNYFAQNAVMISWQHEDFSIEGWALYETKSQPVNYFYVNGRMVKDKVIAHALKQAFVDVYSDNFKQQDALLNYVIYLKLNPNQVDVNVHPAKFEVRFHQARLVHDFIYQAVFIALNKQKSQQQFTQSRLVEVKSNQFENAQPENRAAAGKTIFNATFENKKMRLNTSTNHQIKNNQMREHDLKEDNHISSIKNVLFPERKWPLENHQYQNKFNILQDKNSKKELHASSHLFSTINASPTCNDENEKLNSVATLGRLLSIIDNQYLLLSNESNANSLQILSLKKAQWAFFNTKMQQVNISNKEPLLMPLTLLISAQEAKVIRHFKALLLDLYIELNIEKLKLHLMSVPKLIRTANWQQLLPALISCLSEFYQQNLPNDEVKKELLTLLSEFYLQDINDKIWDNATAINFLSELEQNEAIIMTYSTDFLQKIDLQKTIMKFNENTLN